MNLKHKNSEENQARAGLEAGAEKQRQKGNPEGAPGSARSGQGELATQRGDLRPPQPRPDSVTARPAALERLKGQGARQGRAGGMENPLRVACRGRGEPQ